jgi:hypothetical protein
MRVAKTPVDVERLLELCEAATPGPWRQDPNDTSYVRHPNGWQTIGSVNLNHHDAAFIAAARTAIPALLHIAEAACAWRDAMIERTLFGGSIAEGQRLLELRDRAAANLVAALDTTRSPK